MRARVKGGMLLVLAFVLGVSAGALGFGVYRARMGWEREPRDSERHREFVLRRLTRDLDLRPEQRQQVEVILREAGQEFSHLRDEFGPRVREIRTRSRDRIQAVLDPAQQAKFETLAREWERRHEGASRPEAKESKSP